MKKIFLDPKQTVVVFYTSKGRGRVPAPPPLARADLPAILSVWGQLIIYAWVRD